MANTEKRIKAILELDSNEFSKGLKAVNSELRISDSALKLASAGIKNFGSDSEKLKFVQNELTTQLSAHTKKVDLYSSAIEKTSSKLLKNKDDRDKLKDSIEQADKVYKEAVKTYGKESEEAKKAKEAVNDLKDKLKDKEKAIENNENRLVGYEANMNKAKAAIVNTEGKLKDVTKQLAENESKWISVGKKLEEFSNKAKDVGGKMESVGKTLSTHVSLPLAALGTASVKSAIDFESAFTGVTKTVDGTEEQLASMRSEILEMSKVMPASAVEISGVAEAAGQLRIETENVMSFSKTMIDMGESTNLSSEEAATALARLANITQMPQTEFDRLGSVIVALGNNLATTESEITNMSLRLAGAGSQVGMTEAQIMSFSGALSSVGIEAEAGGSAFSKVMVNMQLAAETGGESLDNFAKVAGMSSSDFQKAFKEDAAGAIITFIEGLSKSEERGISAIKVLDDMGITEVRMRDALLRAAGASDVFKNSIELGSKAWEENNALTQEANKRYGTSESKLQMTKNQITATAISIGEKLLPHVLTITEKIADLVTKFDNLDPSTQKTIMNMGLFAAAAGPVIGTVGKVVSGVGTLAGGLGKLSKALGVAKTAKAATTAISGVGTAASVAGGASGVAGFGGALGLLTNPIGLAVAGTAALAGGMYLLHKKTEEAKEKEKEHLKEMGDDYGIFAERTTIAVESVNTENGKTIKSVQETTLKVDDATKKVVGSYTTMALNVGQKLTEYSLTNRTINDETSKYLLDTYTDMNNKILDSMNAKNQKELEEKTKTINSMKNLSDEEKQALIQKEVEKGETLVNKNNATYQSIVDIITKAKDEKRELTVQEKAQIETLTNEMNQNMLNSTNLAANDKKTILERMKSEDIKITQDTVDSIIEQANKEHDQTVKKANEKYKKQMEIAKQLNADGTQESTDMAQKIIDEAERQKTDTIKKADEQMAGVVESINSSDDKAVEAVEIQGGKIKKKYEKVIGGLKSLWENFWSLVSGGSEENAKKAGESKKPKKANNLNGTSKQSLSLNNSVGLKKALSSASVVAPRFSSVNDYLSSNNLTFTRLNKPSNQNNVSENGNFEKLANALLDKINNMNQKPYSGGVNMTYNFYNPVKSPHEQTRLIKNEWRTMAQQF